MVDHVADEIGCRFDAQFVHYAAFVRADRFGAQAQIGGGFASAPARGDRQQHFVFPG